MRLSVGILSHKRPHLLARVLTGLSQQDISGFEVVVAGDQPALADFNLPGNLADAVKYTHVTEANVSHARNAVIAVAGGEIIAFCDDDAVPEPDWLRRIAEPFANPNVAAVGGLVRARDGLEIEWRGVTFDRSAREHPFDPPKGIHVLGSTEQIATQRFGGLMGANSAFRRAAVIGVGGFDEAYRYFLDETDMALRLAEDGWDMALTDAAEVHHLREANSVRGHLKKPRNLFEVAASKAYFCSRHLQTDGITPEFARFRARRYADCDSFIRIGMMRGDERNMLMAQVNTGLSDGSTRTPRWFDGDWGTHAHTPWPAAGDGTTGLSIAIYCGWGYGRARRLIDVGERLAQCGHRVSVFRFQTGFAQRAVEFRNGVWLHEGGTWRLDHVTEGRPLVLRRSRTEAEIARVHAHRGFDLRLGPARRSHADLSIQGVPPLALQTMPGAVDPGAALARIAVDLDGNATKIISSEAQSVA